MQIIAEWAGHYYDPAENSDKIWASCFTDTGHYLSVWGRRGVGTLTGSSATGAARKYQSLVKQLGSQALAGTEFDRMVAQKQRKGYRQVAFEDGRYGNIPSFNRNLSLPGKTGDQQAQTQRNSGAINRRITGQGLLERIRHLTNRLGHGFEPDSMLIEYRQLDALTQLVLEYGTVSTGNSVDGGDNSDDSIPAELEPALRRLTACIKQALLA